MQKKIIFMMLILITFTLTSCSNNRTTDETAASTPITSEQVVTTSSTAPTAEKSSNSNRENYSDFNVFWSHFRNLILDNNYSEIKKFTQFPLESRGPMDFHPLIEFNEDKFESVLKLYLNQLSGNNYDDTNLDFIKKYQKPDPKDLQGSVDNFVRIGNMNFKLVNNSWKLTFVYLEEESYNKLGIDINNQSNSEPANDKAAKDSSVLESWIGDYEFSEFAPI